MSLVTPCLLPPYFSLSRLWLPKPSMIEVISMIIPFQGSCFIKMTYVPKLSFSTGTLPLPSCICMRDPEAPPSTQHRFGLCLAEPVKFLSGQQWGCFVLSPKEKKKMTGRQRGRQIGKGKAHGSALPAQGPAPASSWLWLKWTLSSVNRPRLLPTKPKHCQTSEASKYAVASLLRDDFTSLG